MKLGRNLKNVVAIGALAAMAAVISLPVYATDITVSNAVNDKTYYAYKIFDATVDGDKVAYTLDASTSDGAAIYDALKDTGVFTFTEIGKDKYTVTLVDKKTDEDVSAAVKNNFTVGTDGKITGLTAPTGVTAANKTATLNVSASGYYFVTTTNGTVVTVDTVKNADISVIDKNKTPGWEPDPDDPSSESGKTVSNDGKSGSYKKVNSVNIGDDAYFKINAYVPTVSNGEKVDSYTITDTLGAGFDAVTADDVTVTFTDDSGKEIDALKNWNKVNTTVSDNTITVTFDVRDAEHKVVDGYPTETHVEITYKTKVNSKAVNDNVNTVNLKYTVGDEEKEKTDISDETHTYVYGFELNKYAEGIKNLKDAKFKLYDSNDNEVKLALVDGSTTDYRVTSSSESAEITTVENGNIKIFGLAEGTYYLEETEAPAGYNKLTARKKVEVLVDDDDNATKLTKVDSDGYAEEVVKIENKAGSILPATGGAGRIALYAVGGVLVIGVGVVMISKKRSSAE